MINYDSLLQAGQEMYNYPAFIRNFHVWKISHLTSRIIPITEQFQLPYNSLLHILDNIPYPDDEVQDVPRVLSNPFILHEKGKKFIYHNTDFLFSDEKHHLPIDIDVYQGTVIDTPTERKYIYRTNKLMQNLLSFKTEYNTVYKQLYSLEQMPSMKDTLILINHNPLFRMFVLGKLRYFRKLQLILASILNLACTLPLYRNQYIHIPLTMNVFPKEDFKKSQTSLAINTIKYPNNYHYLVMMNFLNFVNPQAHTSLLDKIPEDYLSRIVFIFTVGENAIFYPLEDLKKLNEDNKAYLRIVNQFNLLAKSHEEVVQTLVDDLPEEDEDGDPKTQLEKVNSLIKNTKVNISKNKKNIIDTDMDNVLIDTLSSRVSIDTLDESEDHDTLDITEEYSQDEESLLEAESEDTDEDRDFLAEQTEDLVDIIHQHDLDYIRKKQENQVTKSIIQTKINVDRDSKTTTSINTTDISTAITTDVNGETLNSPCVKVFDETPDEGVARATITLAELDSDTEALIENLDLTPAQKNRYKKIATVYKKVKVGTKTIEEWLTTPPNVSVKDKSFDYLEDEIPDKGMLTSSILNLDNNYMQETFGRDLLSVAISFAKNGVFLTDVKVDPINTELNKLVKYTFYYQDVNGKSFSIPFTLPQVNKHGYMYINGTKKIFKKQLVNLPIVKVSPTRVSLASAMNKTIVERNIQKAHSFSNYIATILKKLKASNGITVDYIVSAITINKPLAYEYTTLAKKYRVINVSTVQEKLILYFDYKLRMDFFTKGDKDLLSKLEKFEKKHQAVVCCFKNGYFGCIDVNNTVKFMDRQGVIKHSLESTIVSILQQMSRTSLNMKPLTEWTTLKIKDKNLSIGFILAYQFGLINTLKYLGCHYIRIGRTDKKVIEDINAPKTVPPIPGINVAKESLTTSTEALAPGTKYKFRAGDIQIVFKDEILIINRYPLIQSLIVAGITEFDTDHFNFVEMENTSTYFTLLDLKGYSTNYLKAITGFFSYFIDPMTRDRLEMMKEPTNPRDLLIRSTQLLATEDHRQASSMANHCIRGYERFNTILYNEMSRSLETYQINGGSGSKFSLKPDAILLRIITDQAITPVEELNPVFAIKEITGVTYTGIGGRTAQSFVLEDRQYPQDGTGILSETTVDNGKVGIVAHTSINPNIVNTRGLFEHESPDKLDAAQVLSVTSMLMPGVTNDDQLC